VQVLKHDSKDSERALDAEWKSSLLDPPIIELRTWLLKAIESFQDTYHCKPEAVIAFEALANAACIGGGGEGTGSPRSKSISRASAGVAVSDSVNEPSVDELIETIWAVSKQRAPEPSPASPRVPSSPGRKVQKTARGMTVDTMLKAAVPKR
jgi:hypothetical protein